MEGENRAKKDPIKMTGKRPVQSERGRRGQEAQPKTLFLCSLSTRHFVSREAPACLPRPDGVGGEPDSNERWTTSCEGMKKYGISLGSVENGVYFREEKDRMCLLQKA